MAVALAPTGPLAWEPQYASGVVVKKKKKKKKKKKEKEKKKEFCFDNLLPQINKTSPELENPRELCLKGWREWRRGATTWDQNPLINT